MHAVSFLLLLYKLLYRYEGRTDIELSVSAGELVSVVQRHDETGNPEWWLVQLGGSGRSGYLPANYLTPNQL